MSFSTQTTSYQTHLTSTALYEKQLKAAVTNKTTVELYDEAMTLATTEESLAAVVTFLRLMCIEWENAKELVLFGLASLLSTRYNPNQPNKQGFTSLHSVFTCYDVDFLMLLLAYSANPFLKSTVPHIWHTDKPGGLDPSPPIKWAKLPGKTHHFEFITKHCTRPQHTPSNKMKILGYIITTKNRRKFINLETNKGRFTIQIASTNQLTRKELAIIYKHYKEYFTGSPSLRGTLDNFFMHEMQGQSKLSEIIYSEKGFEEGFIGMNLHKIFQDSRYPNCLSHYISCAYVDKAFCGLGLSDPLMMTLPSLMLKLFKNKLVICSFQAIFIGAAKLLKGLETFPQYRSQFFTQYANDHFAHVQEASDSDPHPVLVNNSPGKCWSKLPVQPIADFKKPAEEVSLDEIFFNWQRGGTHIDRGVFFITSIDNQYIIKYINSCKVKLTLDGGNYLNSVAPHVAELIPELKPKFIPETVVLPDHHKLFKGVIAASETVIPAATASTNTHFMSKL